MQPTPGKFKQCSWIRERGEMKDAKNIGGVAGPGVWILEIRVRQAG